MKPLEVLARLDRLQQARTFKIVASAVLVALALSVLIIYAVSIQSRAQESRLIIDPGTGLGATAPAAPTADGEPAEEDPALIAARKTLGVLNQITGRSSDWTAMAVGVGVALAVSLTVVWIGLGLTYLGLGLITGLVVLPLMTVFRSYYIYRNANGDPSLYLRDIGAFIGAVVVLTASFVGLMQALKLALSGPWSVAAIARNVVNEAVRMRVSLVFIIMLIFGLAALPGLLDAGTPLRYRVQAFLQYGTGGTFWVIAIMTLFLSVGSVAFEQRDRVIWQTMTKPVSPWQYVLGKWVGVAGVAAVLLAVSSSGVFLFTEYLRLQPAQGEIRAYLSGTDAPVTEDRFILESQVLTARRVVRPSIDIIDATGLETLVTERFASALQADGTLKDTAAVRQRLRYEILQELRQQHLTIESGRDERYIFTGLTDAASRASSLTLRYKVDSGGNDPRTFYKLTFYIPGTMPTVEEVPLGQAMKLDISPSVIDENGQLTMVIANGDAGTDEVNPASITFPPDGLELYYGVGSYRANFLRVVFILWLKLGFLAMLGIVAATFLAFPVASLVAFGVFLMAESAAFLSESLQYYDAAEQDGTVIYWRVVVRLVALPVSYIFRFYSNLKPTRELIEGKLVGWSTLGGAVFTLGLLTAILYLAGSLIFRKRELATYSGQ
ncbi:MAG: hypothetical protein H7Y88_08735 [Phycisphaerales bacterium]|nr:hypothetical protein [Phycisphaerales bacterium]